VGTQYRSAIYVLDAEQKQEAEDSKRKYQARLSAAGGGLVLRYWMRRCFIMLRTITSSTWRRTPTDIADWRVWVAYKSAV